MQGGLVIVNNEPLMSAQAWEHLAFRCSFAVPKMTRHHRSGVPCLSRKDTPGGMEVP